MKKSCFTLFFFIPALLWGQGIAFEVEKLSKPERLLPLTSPRDIWENLILKDAYLYKQQLQRENIDFKYNILAQSDVPDSLFHSGYHSFFYAMYNAYADHRPFVLSPDMIWLLISQGFARHVNAQPEKLRPHFVDFSDKMTLLVEAKNGIDSASMQWEEIFPRFTAQIAQHTGEDLIRTLTADFSTTTAVEKVASEITVMEAMKSYFEFVVFRVVCGIPEITLLGTPEDWEKVLEKSQALGKYDLRWWTDALRPLLEEFVNASKGDIDQDFWRNMFKYHTPKKYGAPKIIDGWIVTFFPYDKEGKRNNLKELTGGDSLPEEIVKTDIKFIETDGVNKQEKILELWAGFMGAEQNPLNFALTPRIGWMIREKDVEQQALFRTFQSRNIPDTHLGPTIDLKINEVPAVLKKFDLIYSLGLHFKQEVHIPEWLKKITIGKLFIHGKISEAETAELIRDFPTTELNINEKVYNAGKNRWLTVSGGKIPEDLQLMERIWILEIHNGGLRDEEICFPENMENVTIENISLANKASEKEIEMLKKLFPESHIFISGQRIQ